MIFRVSSITCKYFFCEGGSQDEEEEEATDGSGSDNEAGSGDTFCYDCDPKTDAPRP